ncbi:MAG TPA: hypothetical protein VFK28_04705 [Sphingomicrobium sp.]|nr:hypothetical protein [Sphingomicrobium sp.]
MKLKLLFAAVAVAAATPAFAQSSPGVSVGVTGGTLGIGPEAAYRFSNTLGVRGNATFLGVGRSVESDDIDYDGDLKLASGGLMLDLHPFGGGFRVSAGARINNNRVSLKATPTSDVEVGGETYTPAEIGVLSGKVEGNSLAPTLTIGWGGRMTRGVHFGIEAGGMFQGSPRVRNLTATGMLASDPEFQASLREEAREIENDIDQFKIYPILQIAVGYRF